MPELRELSELIGRLSATISRLEAILRAAERALLTRHWHELGGAWPPLR